MNPKKKIFFFVYQWFVLFPILLVITILVATATIILSPILPNSQLSYYPARWWARIICKLSFVRVKIIGLEFLKQNQSYVIVLNHQSIFDIFAVYGWLPNIFKWMMKAELRQIPLVGKACESAGHIFIDRKNPVAAKHSLQKAESKLTNGVSLVVFPEGTRTFSGKMGKFKRGAFQIATDLNLAVVPVTLRGSYERMHRNTMNVTPGIIEMIVHSPIDIHNYQQDKFQELVQTTWNIINSDL